MKPDFSVELQYKTKSDLIFGIDEVGRGSLAGPLTLCCLCLKKEFINNTSPILKLGIKDSKKLTPKKRFDLIQKTKKYLAEKIILHNSNKRIDKLGISLCYKKSLTKLIKLLAKKYPKKKIVLLTDFFNIEHNQENITIVPIKSGDNLSATIALSAIYAKVTRDKIMEIMHTKLPMYDWISNKGYGTAKHITAIKKYSVSELHRQSFLNKVLSTRSKHTS